MECTICNLQYVGKNEPPFNIRLCNHTNNVKYSKTILADKHFQKNCNRFKHGRFPIIDRLTNTNVDKKNLKRMSYSKRKLLDTKSRNSLS